MSMVRRSSEAGSFNRIDEIAAAVSREDVRRTPLARAAAAAVVALALGAAAGCGSDAHPSGGGSPTGSPTADLVVLRGIVVTSPTKPNVRPGESSTAPVAGASVVVDRAGQQVASARTDARGRVRFELPAGSYQVVATSPAGLQRRATATVQLVAAPVLVRLVLDSGIR